MQELRHADLVADERAYSTTALQPSPESRAALAALRRPQRHHEAAESWLEAAVPGRFTRNPLYRAGAEEREEVDEAFARAYMVCPPLQTPQAAVNAH